MGDRYSLVVSAVAWLQLSRFDVGAFRSAQRELDRLVAQVQSLDLPATASRETRLGRFHVRYALDIASHTLTVLAISIATSA